MNTQRIAAIDQLRGLVIVLMGLDHVRGFFSPFPFQPEDLSQTSPELFFTRWITHFCAPVFILLTGMSAFLFEQKVQSRTELRNFLLSRGIWLMFIEVVVVNAAWKFAFPPWVFLQVIWVIGLSMVCLAGLIYLPRAFLLALGVLMVFGHNLLDPITTAQFGNLSWLWGLLHQKHWIPLNSQGAGIFVAYPLIPWVGVMAIGYACAGWLTEKADEFSNKALKVGLAFCLGFVLLRFLNIYGDPVSWTVQDRGTIYTLLSFLNMEKYPPSLLFLLMTLGPAMLLLSLLQRVNSSFQDSLLMFGRVPFFYYVLHVPLIHLGAVIWFNIFIDAPVGWQMQGVSGFPDGYAPSMLRLYVAWVAITGLMYFACKWYSGIKQRHDHWILKYL